MDRPGHHRPRAGRRDERADAGGGSFPLPPPHSCHTAAVAGLPSHPPAPSPHRAPRQPRPLTLAQVPQSAASVIVATEPLWASAFGLLLLGEGLDPQCVVGGALVVAACVVSGLEPAAVRAALPFLPGGVRSR